MTSLSKSRRHRSGRAHHGFASLRAMIGWRSITGMSSNLSALLLLWVALLLLGGSSRGDVAQLVLLRPLAVLIAAYGFWTLRRDHLASHRFLAFMAGAILLLVMLHLVPLPWSLWSALPGRELIVSLDQGSTLKGGWRPLAMAPASAWNALFSLMVPLAVLVNGVQLSREERARLGAFVLIGGIASAILSFFQLFATPNGLLYFYTIRLDGPEAVGFFANRNHQALLVAAMFPLLAAFAARRGVSATHDERRALIAFALGLFLIPLLIVTGSRAGLVAGVIGLASAPLIYARGAKIRRRERRVSRGWIYGGGAAALLVVFGLVMAANRSIAIQRLIASLSQEDQRYGRWATIVDNLGRFLPFGSGVGSYQSVFQSFEPRASLTATYSNHAHNDWLEVLLTTGVPGGILLLAGVAAFIVALVRFLRSSDRGQVPAYHLAALLVILMIALASLVDYPVRAPLISALLVMACLWASADCRASTERGELGAERLS